MTGLYRGAWKQDYFNVDPADLREAMIDAYGAPIEDSEAIIVKSTLEIPYLSIDEATEAQRRIDDAVRVVLAELAILTNSANQPIHDDTDVSYRGQSVETPVDRTVILTLNDHNLCSLELLQNLTTILSVELPLWRIHVYPAWDIDCGVLVQPDQTIHDANGIMSSDSLNSWIIACVSGWNQTTGVRCRQFADLQKRHHQYTDATATPTVLATYDSFEGNNDYYSLWIKSIGRLSDCRIIEPDDIARNGWYYIQKSGQIGQYKGTADSEEPSLITEWVAPKRGLPNIAVRWKGDDHLLAVGPIICDDELLDK